ncbi:hypothetical protein [Chitinophaga eiseniae]|uniref:Lipoprotein n=1 Tax=Chitinophaga eiseniae TaxID=634771 RepID=A0A847S4R3_9BACT|nr:hypothetical protein [Chitinophaga eiseniae]NLR78260.1 hypothetical protein [Chitinophaga eiseniae]
MKKYLYLVTVAVTLYACSSEKRYAYTYSRRADGVLETHERVEEGGFNIPWKVKKKKQAVHPSMAFVESVKEYRRTFQHFPQDMWNLENMNDRSRNAFKIMKEMGFNELSLDYVYIDSFVVAFTHKPVYNQKLGHTTLSGQDVTGKFIFTYNRADSSFSYIRKLN